MDAFRSLKLPPLAVDPDPAFARRLRARLEGDQAMTTSALVPYLAVPDARAALRWLDDVFGTTPLMDPIEMPDGRIGHAEVLVAGAKLMLADEFPDIGHTAPVPGAGSPVTLHVELRDVDATFRRAVAAGARSLRAPADADHGRTASLIDPSGHRWLLYGAPTGRPFDDTSHGIRHGDVGYVSLWVPDVERAERFWHHVLGWAIEHRQVVGQTIAMGLAESDGATGGFLAIAVEDVEAARAAVVAEGGTASAAEDRSFGRLADCTDGQGLAFAVYTPAGGVSHGPGLPVNGELHGDVSYLTIATVDSARLRSLLSAVAGWSFTGGRVDDGWEAAEVMPMTGLAGGHERSLVAPMFRVDDIDAAVIRVREAGGTATDVVDVPYGRSSTCTDDQGTEFWLGQH